MDLSILINRKFIFNNFKYTISIIGIMASLMTIVGISLKEIFPNTSLINRLLGLFIIYFTLMVIISLFRQVLIFKKGISIKINNNTVYIKQGDIFKVSGKKVIPFNEYFDTSVNDVIVAKNSLHGIFLDKYVNDKEEIMKSIAADKYSKFKRYKKNNRWAYPIGRIIPHNNYLLLSFTQFNDQNEAHLTKSDYENCLKNMWEEVSRTYSYNPVYLPLLGSGITRFDDWSKKTNLDLLKCILYALYLTRVDINKPITILLRKEVMVNINIFELKGVNLL